METFYGTQGLVWLIHQVTSQPTTLRGATFFHTKGIAYRQRSRRWRRLQLSQAEVRAFHPLELDSIQLVLRYCTQRPTDGYIIHQHI
jgi:hypothetical protein